MSARTGYVHELIDKDLNFKQFVMLTAKAFGACITMRDDSLSAEIPEEFTPDNYHANSIKELNEKYNTILNMSDDEYQKYAHQQNLDEIHSYMNIIDENDKGNEKILEILPQVEKYVPPTNDHIQLKEFMIQQLKDSINDSSYYKKELDKLKKSDIISKTEVLEQISNDINYHTEYNNKEIETVKKRNKWIKELRESLK